MKTALLILAITIAFFSNTFAQNEIDVKIGVNIDRGYRNAATLAPPTNYLFGFSLDHYIKNDLFLKVGFNYNNHTRNLKDVSQNWGTLERIVTKSSFEIPLCLGLRKEVSPFNLYILGGPIYQYHLQGDIYSRIIDAAETQTIYESITWGNNGDQWKIWEMGVYGEIGLEYKYFLLSASYMRGLTQQFSSKTAPLKTTIVKDSNNNTHDLTYGVLPFSAKVFSINITYIIPLDQGKSRL